MDEGAPIQLDLSRWPLILTRCAGAATDAAVLEFTRRLTALIQERAQPYVTVTDLRGSADLTPSQRGMISDAMNRQAAVAPCLGAGLILDSRLLSLLMRGALIIRKPPHDTRVFNDLESALRWGELVLRRARHAG